MKSTASDAEPHCPLCASYALYHKNNIDNYECLKCELHDIPEEIARRVQ
jgi:Zn ribbon nucleic-acid-binding protein